MPSEFRSHISRSAPSAAQRERTQPSAGETPAHHDPVLQALPDALISALGLSRHRRVKVERGRSIISAKSKTSHVYLISEGWAVSKLDIEIGDTQILDILGPGSFAGLSRLDEIDHGQYSAVALQGLMAYRIEADALQDACAADESLSSWLAEQLSHEVQRSQRHIAALGRLPARGRLAFVMLRIIDVAQQTGEAAVGTTIRLPMTQEEIGNMLGLTNVSISKLMSAFRKEGLIDYGRNRIVVRNIEALSDICGMSLETSLSQSDAAASSRPVENSPSGSGSGLDTTPLRINAR